MIFSGELLWLRPGEGISMSGRVPEGAEFFQDHFPEFPVLPGVLALEILRQTAESYLKATTGADLKSVFEKMEAVKFSSYFKPGDAWESRVTFSAQEDGETIWNGKLLKDTKPACSARFKLKTIKC